MNKKIDVRPCQGWIGGREIQGYQHRGCPWWLPKTGVALLVVVLFFVLPYFVFEWYLSLPVTYHSRQPDGQFELYKVELWDSEAGEYHLVGNPDQWAEENPDTLTHRVIGAPGQ